MYIGGPPHVATVYNYVGDDNFENIALYYVYVPHAMYIRIGTRDKQRGRYTKKVSVQVAQRAPGSEVRITRIARVEHPSRQGLSQL